MIREIARKTLPGIPALIVLLLALAGGVWLLTRGAVAVNFPLVATGVGIDVLALFLMIGLFTLKPNQGRVLQLFGAYKGTERHAGLRWANPFFSKKSVSLRLRNFESGRLKVNDLNGSPIEIASVVVWRVVDTAEAVFEVDDFEHFIQIQSESALRGMASRYPYDHDDEEDHDGLSLRGSAEDVSDMLKKNIEERVTNAGLEIIEARISHLAYSPEIASAMLQRQQAAAIIAARRRIVDGAVGMVDMALAKLTENNVLELDEERKAAMVSNLLVVLCGDRNAQPVVNAGTLHH